MSHGENKLYKYILDENIYYAKLNVQACVTKTILRVYSEREIERIKKLEPELSNFFFGKISSPLFDRYGYAGVLEGVLRNVDNGIFCDMQGDQGCWQIDPLKGKSIVITYDAFDSVLGISKAVAKNCIERLLEKEKISRKRSFGGYEYSLPPKEIAKGMVANPGEWKPRSFDPTTMFYKEDQKFQPIVEAFQVDFEPIQLYYERSIEEEAKKYI